MERTVKQKITEVIEDLIMSIGYKENRNFPNIKPMASDFSNKILEVIKEEILDLSTFKTKIEKEVLDEIKNWKFDKGQSTATIERWQEKVKVQ